MGGRVGSKVSFGKASWRLRACSVSLCAWRRQGGQQRKGAGEWVATGQRAQQRINSPWVCWGSRACSPERRLARRVLPPFQRASGAHDRKQRSKRKLLVVTASRPMLVIVTASRQGRGRPTVSLPWGLTALAGSRRDRPQTAFDRLIKNFQYMYRIRVRTGMRLQARGGNSRPSEFLFSTSLTRS